MLDANHLFLRLSALAEDPLLCRLKLQRGRLQRTSIFCQTETLKRHEQRNLNESELNRMDQPNRRHEALC